MTVTGLVSAARGAGGPCDRYDLGELRGPIRGTEGGTRGILVRAAACDPHTFIAYTSGAQKSKIKVLAVSGEGAWGRGRVLPGVPS